MSLPTSPIARAAIGICLAMVALLEVRALVLGLRAHAHLRDRTVGQLDRVLMASRPRWAAAMEPGDREALLAGLKTAMEATHASGGEVLGEDGQRLAAIGVDPGPPSPPVAGILGSLLSGRLTAQQVAPDGRSVFCFARVPTMRGTIMMMRLRCDVPQIGEDLQSRRELFINQALVLLLVLAAGALVTLAPRPSASAAPPAALLAYEAAVDRLRSHEQELSERHATDRRRMEEELEDREVLARAGELTSGIVHEVRNGLSTIVGYARLLERAVLEPERAHARAIREECELLESVVRRFIDFIQHETLTLAHVDLASLLSRVVAHESRARPGGAVTLSAPAGLGVRADEALLERAFENLVRNAREAAGASGRVWVEVVPAPEGARITVADDGPGMDPELRARLRPFVTTKPGGLGLGLAIALKVVRLHGGSLALGDRNPRGLSVIVSLPTLAPGGSA